MSLEAFKIICRHAKTFVHEYEEKQILIQLQMTYKASSVCNIEEGLLLSQWMSRNTTWLVDNEAKYNKCLAILALPDSDITELYNLYRGHDDNRDLR